MEKQKKRNNRISCRFKGIVAIDKGKGIGYTKPKKSIEEKL